MRWVCLIPKRISVCLSFSLIPNLLDSNRIWNSIMTSHLTTKNFTPFEWTLFRIRKVGAFNLFPVCEHSKERRCHGPCCQKSTTEAEQGRGWECENWIDKICKWVISGFFQTLTYYGHSAWNPRSQSWSPWFSIFNLIPHHATPHNVDHPPETQDANGTDPILLQIPFRRIRESLNACQFDRFLVSLELELLSSIIKM